MGFLVPRMYDEAGGGGAIGEEVTCFGVVTDAFDRTNTRERGFARMERGRAVPSRCAVRMAMMFLDEVGWASEKSVVQLTRVRALNLRLI